jgi:hypothetical protein
LGLNVCDFDFVLAGVVARFPHGNPVTIGGQSRGAVIDGCVSQTFPANGATVVAPLKESRVDKEDLVPPDKVDLVLPFQRLTTHVNGRFDKTDCRHPNGGADLPVYQNVLNESQIGPFKGAYETLSLMWFLTSVVRDPSADVPSMARKAVQKRLNKKRKELQLEFFKLSLSPSNGWLGLCTLNSVQKFRLILSDSIETEGVLLETNPMPADVTVHFDFLKEIAVERVSKAMVSNQGFYTNDDKQYLNPKGIQVGPILDEAW